MTRLTPKELDKLANLWEHHRVKCRHEGDASIEQSSGGGIGTNTYLTCGCGEKFDVTDYLSW